MKFHRLHHHQASQISLPICFFELALSWYQICSWLWIFTFFTHSIFLFRSTQQSLVFEVFKSVLCKVGHPLNLAIDFCPLESFFGGWLMVNIVFDLLLDHSFQPSFSLITFVPALVAKSLLIGQAFRKLLHQHCLWNHRGKFSLRWVIFHGLAQHLDALCCPKLHF